MHCNKVQYSGSIKCKSRIGWWPDTPRAALPRLLTAVLRRHQPAEAVKIIQLDLLQTQRHIQIQIQYKDEDHQPAKDKDKNMNTNTRTQYNDKYEYKYKYNTMRRQPACLRG